MVITIKAWGEGDRTVGDGTLTADVTMDLAEESVQFVKDELRKMLSTAWDLQERRIHVMTQAEFDAFVKEEEV